MNNLENINLANHIEELPMQGQINILEKMHAKAEQSALDAFSYDFLIKVSDIINEDGISYFYIENETNEDRRYVIYQIGNEIYYINEYDFEILLNEIQAGRFSFDALKYKLDSVIDQLDYIDASDEDECLDLVNMIISSIGFDKPYSIEESIKIKKPGLGCNGDQDKSKFVDDILHGDEESKNFEKEVERETLKAGVDNPLVTPALTLESVKLSLPNAHQLMEKANIRISKIIYEPMDWVIIKKTGMKAQVNDVVNNGDGDLVMLTIVASDGVCYDCDPSEIEPDPLYILNLPGRVLNSQGTDIPENGWFNIDPETRMPNKLENDIIDKNLHADLNGNVSNDPLIPTYVVVDGMRVDSVPYYAFAEDIANSKKNVRVINNVKNVLESEIYEYDAIKNLEFLEKPYAVIVDSNGKPVRSVRIDPKSFIEAKDDDMVDCEVDGKIVQFPKKCIDMLS